MKVRLVGLVTLCALTLILSIPGSRDLEIVTIHEFGHQYFYGMLASNEFEEAWLDEGVNEYVSGLVVESQLGGVPTHEGDGPMAEDLRSLLGVSRHPQG